jgi:UDP-N-acetylmuramoyl-L-alanyl-D-glutamate--2,6-diaminopimelate ligase
LALGRVGGATFSVAVFTNLSQDHLDFHRDMADYFAAKASLFTATQAHRGVVCVDDEWGRRLVDVATIPITTLGPPPADWEWQRATVAATNSTVQLRAPDGSEHLVESGLPGSFNLRNAAAAYVALIEANVPAADARHGVAALAAVPGRMERIDEGQPFHVLVDYAHTPDAVRTLLAEARTLATGGRVLVVLGCGGDRDKGKRPLMGAAAATAADVAVFTNDNPRSEDPREILDAMLAGASDARAEVVVEPDRAAAIAAAIGRARPGDIVVVAGKGHEQGQEYADRTLPFDDRNVVRTALHAHGFAGVA